MRILGIETSCDETAAAVIEGEPGEKKVKLISNVVASSLALHSKTGGIIPEIAAREQVKYIIPVIKEALSKLKVENLDAIAVTVGPGLIGSLLVGVETAKTLAYVWKKPIVPVNHLIGHIYANWINPPLSVLGSQSSDSGQSVNQLVRKLKTDNEIPFPALSLIVSGGHTDLVLMRKHGSIKWLGGTRDDAAGEAFDKIGRLLGLPYPGGPSIEKAAQNGDPKAFNFPRPMLHSNDFSGEARPGFAWDFSFSGLKTSVLRHVKTIEQLSNRTIADISASAQQAIIDVLITKTLKAAQQYRVKSILLGGGVAANQKLRDQFALEIRNLSREARSRSAGKLEIELFAPPKNLCTDNGAMIDTAAFFNYKPIPWQKLTANPELYFD